MGDEFQQLQQIALSAGLKAVDVPGDGDCMFHALVISLSERNITVPHKQLRMNLSKYLEDHPNVNDDITNPRSHFIEAEYLGLQTAGREAQWSEYKKRIGISATEGGIWGDGIALQALSEMLKMEITVYYHNGAHTDHIGQPIRGSIAVGLLNTGSSCGQHYCAMVNTQSNISQSAVLFPSLVCNCCSQRWRNKRSLSWHLVHMKKERDKVVVCEQSHSVPITPICAMFDEVNSTYPNQDNSSDSDVSNKTEHLQSHSQTEVKQVRKSQRMIAQVRKEADILNNANRSTVKKGQLCPDCGITYVKSHKRCKARPKASTQSKSTIVSDDGSEMTTDTASVSQKGQGNFNLSAPDQTIKRRKREAGNVNACDPDDQDVNGNVTQGEDRSGTQTSQSRTWTPVKCRGKLRKDYVTVTPSKILQKEDLPWTKKQMETDDTRYFKLKEYHDRCRGEFNNIATMKMTPEIEQIVADIEIVELRTDEEKTNPLKYTWSKDEEARLNSLNHSAKLLKPPRWPWCAPEGSTQYRFNHKQMNDVVKNELQYTLLKCPTCGITAMLVGKDQQGAEQCMDCLEMRRRKQQIQDKFVEAWNKVRPNDTVPKIVDNSSRDNSPSQDLPTLNPAEQAVIALVQPAVTIKRNYIANLKYKQESLNIMHAADKTWCHILPRTDLRDRFVVIERRSRNVQSRYMIADPNKVRKWLQYLFANHETYIRKRNNNQLELSEEALTALEEQSELASVDYDDTPKDSNTEQVDDTEYPPPSAELDSGLSSLYLFGFDKSDTLYAKKQTIMKLIGDGKVKIIKEDDPSRKRVFDPHVSTNIAFPHLYPNGESAPTDFAEHTLARYLLKKQSQFAQTTSDGKRQFSHADNGVHMMHEYARIVEMNVRALVGWYVSQSPERANIPLDGLLNAFREGVGEHGIMDTHMPELHGLMSCIRNSREKWFSERQMMEAISRDCGEPNLFFTLNMDARAWPDVRKLMYELEEGSRDMPPDYFEKDTDKFSRMVDKYAVQLSVYLKHRANVFTRAFLCDICRIDPSKGSKKTPRNQDTIEEGWYWQRVEFTSTRGIQHHHCVARLPFVLESSVLARIIQTMRVVRTELKFGNIKNYEKAWEVVEVGLLASRYLVLFADSISTCSFFNKEMSTDSYDGSAVVDIESLRQEFRNNYIRKDINRKTHPIMRQFDDTEHCDENRYVEMAKVASVSCLHNCIQSICGGDEKTGKGCRFQYPHKKLKFTVPAMIQIDSERMELQVLSRRTCDRVPNLQQLFLQYYRGNHDFTVLVDAAHKLRYVSKYVSKSGQIESLLTEVIELLDQKSSSLSPPTVKHALSNLLLADCSHKAYMSKSELAYNVLDLKKVERSFSFVKTVAYYPRAVIIEECPNSASGVVELSDRTEYSAYAERCRDVTEVKGSLTKKELEEMNLREFAEQVNYTWIKRRGSAQSVQKNETAEGNETDVEPDDDDDMHTANETQPESSIQWRCRDVRSGHWVMSRKRIFSHVKWSNPLYTDLASNYDLDTSVDRFSQLDFEKRRQLQRVYMEMICYNPWKEDPDRCFLPADVLQSLKDNVTVDPDASCRYSLVRLHEYYKVYMQKWNAGQVAPAGSQWHRDNQYSYTMYLSSIHNGCVKKDRAKNDGIYVARYEGDDDLVGTTLEVSPHVTTLYDGDEYPSTSNYIPCEILEEIESQPPLKTEDLFVAHPDHASWKELKSKSTRKSSGLFMADPPVPNVDFSQLSAMRKLAVDLIDLKNNKVKILYIYGKAGSGKTTIAQFLCQKFKGKVQAAAGTGKAASNFNGPTIHGAFGWSADLVNQSIQLTPKKKQILQVFYKDTELFIFDEINATAAYTLCYIDRTMRELFSPMNTVTGKPVNIPFGGKRVVFLGDSAQLRPVKATAIYDKTINATLFGRKSQSLVKYINDTKTGQQIYRKYLMPNCIYLVRGHRNTGLLQQIMDALREGDHTLDDLDKLLYQREKHPEFIANRGIHYSNESAMLYNCRQIWADCKKLGRYLHVSRSIYHMTDTNSNVVSVLSKIPASEYSYAQDVLCLALGAEVRLITNLDTSSGLVTNLTGTIVRILYDNNDKDAVLRGDHPPPYCVVVKFASFKGFVTPHTLDRWFPFHDRSLVPLYRQKFPIKSVPESVRKLQQRKDCYREQFPLDLCGHLTAHRSQGQTFSGCTLAVNLGFESPQNKIPMDAASITYVACSRINHLKDIFVSPIFPSVWEKLGHTARDEERREHEKELKLCAENFALKFNVYHDFLEESNFQHQFANVDEEWKDIKDNRLAPCPSSDSMMMSDQELKATAERLEADKLISYKPGESQRYIGIDQGSKTFSIVAIDKSPGLLPAVVGAEQYNLQDLGLADKFNTGNLILLLQEHTCLFSWMNGDPLPESTCTAISRVVVLVEQMSVKNRYHKQFNAEFGSFLQQQLDFDKCVVKMSQPHNHRKNGPMFKLGEEIVNELNLQAISYQSLSKKLTDVVDIASGTDSGEEEDNSYIEVQRLQRQQYRIKKKMSESIFRYFVSASNAQQTAMQVTTTSFVQHQWSQRTLDKYDDLGDALLHALNELLCGGSRYRQLIPTSPTLHRNRTVVLTVMPYVGYWVTMECIYNQFLIQDFCTYKTHVIGKTFKDPATVLHILKHMPESFTESITAFEPTVDALTPVDQIKVIVKQLKGFQKSLISRSASGCLTNATVEAIKTCVDNVVPIGESAATNTKKFGWQYTRTVKETGQKIYLSRSTGKHLNAVLSCTSWMKENVPEFIRDRPQKLSPHGRLKFFNSLNNLAKSSQTLSEDQPEQSTMGSIKLSSSCQRLLVSNGHKYTDVTKKILADLILIGINNNSQYISAISSNYRAKR